MATAVDFKGANTQLMAPAGNEHNVSVLPVFRNGMVCVSCWELSEEERAEVARTGKVFLSVYSGATQPPVFVGGEDATREVVVDVGGVWRR